MVVYSVTPFALFGFLKICLSETRLIFVSFSGTLTTDSIPNLQIASLLEGYTVRYRHDKTCFRYAIVSVPPIAVADAAPVYSRKILYEVNSLYSVTLYCCEPSLMLYMYRTK